MIVCTIQFQFSNESSAYRKTEGQVLRCSQFQQTHWGLFSKEIQWRIVLYGIISTIFSAPPVFPTDYFLKLQKNSGNISTSLVHQLFFRFLFGIIYNDLRIRFYFLKTKVLDNLNFHQLPFRLLQTSQCDYPPV